MVNGAWDRMARDCMELNRLIDGFGILKRIHAVCFQMAYERLWYCYITFIILRGRRHMVRTDWADR